MAMAYSLHVGSDKNRKLSSKGITTKSGTTSLTNNGIQNILGWKNKDLLKEYYYEHPNSLIDIS